MTGGALGRVLVAAVLASLSALAVAAGPGPKSVLGLWRIDQARVEPLIDRSRARLDFGADGQLSGHTSCNTLRAEYKLDGSDLRLGPVVTTRTACPPLQLEQEDRILTALELAVSAKVRDDGLLELRDADGRGVLRGTRFDAGISSSRSSPAPAGRSAAASAAR